MELIAHKNAIQLVKTRNVITKPENALKSNRYFIKRYWWKLLQKKSSMIFNANMFLSIQIYLFVNSFTCTRFCIVKYLRWLFFYIPRKVVYIVHKSLCVNKCLSYMCASMFTQVSICKVCLCVLADRWTNRYSYHWRKRCCCNCSSCPYFCHNYAQEVRLTETISNLLFLISKLYSLKKIY